MGRAAREDDYSTAPDFSELNRSDERAASFVFFSLGLSSLSVFNIMTLCADLWKWIIGNNSFSFRFPQFYNTPCLPVQVIYLFYLFHIPSKARLLPAVIFNPLLLLFALIAFPMVREREDIRETVLTVFLSLSTVAGATNAMLNAAIFGTGGIFGSSRVLAAIMAGQGLAGLLPSIIRIVLMIIETSFNLELSPAIWYTYFALNALTCLPPVIAAFILYTRPALRQRMRLIDDQGYWGLTAKAGVAGTSGGSLLDGEEDSDAPRETGRLTVGQTLLGILRDMWSGLKSSWAECIALFCCFGFTLSVYPGVVSSFKSPYEKDSVGQRWWTTALLFSFVLADYIGRSLPQYQVMKPRSRWGIAIAHVLIYLRIPAVCVMYYYCFSPPSPGIQALQIISVFLVFGISNGYLSTCMVSWGPTHAEEENVRNSAGVLCSLFLNAGLTVGVQLTGVASHLIH